MASSSNAPTPPAAGNMGNSPFIGAQSFDTTVKPKPAGAKDFPELTNFAKLPFFSFKNGVPGDAMSLLVKATIPPGFYWRGIEGLPSVRAKEHVAVYIKTAYLGLMDALPPGMPEGKVMKAAVLIGAARAMVTTFYEIEATDLIPGETAAAIYTATHIGEGVYSMTVRDGLSQAIIDRIDDPVDLNPTIMNVLPSIHLSAIAVPAVQGWSLMMTGHHYLSDGNSQSRKAFAAMEKQHWRANNVSSWWNDDIELCTDCLWHKACHPINLTNKYRYATSNDVKEMLIIAGAGSGASRLPAKESELRAANSHLVLLQTVRTMYEAYGGSLDYSLLEYAVELTETYSTDPKGKQGPASREPGTPDWVVDRPSAVRFVSEIMKANTDIAAHAYGFYIAMTEQSTLMGAATTTDTLKTSYSLTKLRNQSTAAYTAGYQAFADYNAFKAKQRQAGEYQPIAMLYRYSSAAPPPGLRSGM